MQSLPLLATVLIIGCSALPIEDWKNSMEYARMVKDLGIDNYAVHLGLHGAEKQNFDEIVAAFAKDEISLEEALLKIEQAAPAAYRILIALLEDYRKRVAAVQSKEAREYIAGAERVLLDIPLAMALQKEGSISLEERNKRISFALIEASFGLLKTHMPARREIVGMFPESLPYLENAGIRLHKLLLPQ